MNICGKFVGENHPVFIIAEIGQNHQGSLEIAKEMILEAKVHTLFDINCVYNMACPKSGITCLWSWFSDPDVVPY